MYLDFFDVIDFLIYKNIFKQQKRELIQFNLTNLRSKITHKKVKTKINSKPTKKSSPTKLILKDKIVGIRELQTWFHSTN